MVSIDTYVYEVGIAVSSSQASLPLPYINTTNGSIVVKGLLDATCYVFGVRVYSLRIGQPGNWVVNASKTKPWGRLIITDSITKTHYFHLSSIQFNFFRPAGYHCN